MECTHRVPTSLLPWRISYAGVVAEGNIPGRPRRRGISWKTVLLLLWEGRGFFLFTPGRFNTIRQSFGLWVSFVVYLCVWGGGGFWITPKGYTARTSHRFGGQIGKLIQNEILHRFVNQVRILTQSQNIASVRTPSSATNTQSEHCIGSHTKFGYWFNVRISRWFVNASSVPDLNSIPSTIILEYVCSIWCYLFYAVQLHNVHRVWARQPS